MKKILFFFASALFFVLASCNSSVIKHSPQYSFGAKPDPFNCAIILPEMIDVYYSGSVESLPEGTDKRQRVVSFFRSQLRDEVEKRAVFNRVYDTYLLGEFAKRRVRLRVGRDEKTFFVPMPQEKITCQSVVPHVVIVLQNMEFLSGKRDRKKDADGSSGTLFVNLKFVVWDNDKCELVSHGYLEVNGSGATEQGWKNVVAAVARKIVAGTPFEKKG